ncbi:hypothetical protein [uncultured Microbacterium sp.]|uniref:hypothetical protein n=1 Tax=uncultured Microbacterium sp. TaxID=191216 RepID=UPI00260E2154|nr:hypothetical protein [uncultured Microbacterium sp.]
MASKRATTSTPVETIEAAAFDEALPAINDALDRFIKSVTVTSTHYRYKAIRAIAFQAFTNAIEDGTFDALVDQAIANAGDLPAGWGGGGRCCQEARCQACPGEEDRGC